MSQVDLNCDVGESFGAYRLEPDPEIFSIITSANIACGFHAGDPATMRKTVELALRAGVAVGAHPGLPDLAGFGRRNMDISAEEAGDIITYQIGALMAFVKAGGGQLRHVKPHGALYNMAAQNAELAEAIAGVIYKIDPALTLFGLAGSELIKAGQEKDLQTASEVFADRTYQADGTLTPRRMPGALVTDINQAVGQAVRVIREGKITSQQGTDIDVRADTICVHGDNSHALEMARHIRRSLEECGVTVKAPVSC